MSELVELDGLIFTVRRSARRCTLGITVDRGGSLHVHVPASDGGGGDEEVVRWVRSKLGWVHRMLARKAELAAGTHTPEYVSGESFCFLGAHYRLLVVADAQAPLRLRGDRFYLTIAAARDGCAHFRQWFTAAGSEWLATRLPELARRVGRVPVSVRVGELRHRWGTCHPTGGVRVDWRLFQMPPRLIEYVVLHELVHLAHANHGPSFWRALGNALPDWAQRRDALDVATRDVYWCWPGRSGAGTTGLVPSNSARTRASNASGASGRANR